MKNDLLEFSRQLALLVSACRDYDEMQAEILTLRDSYIEGGIPEADNVSLSVLLLLERIKEEKDREEHERRVEFVKAAINTLSYTELEVVLRIFDALNGQEGVLIAGKITDSLGVNRSVVVSALRKLESARIVETRSLGVKGTYIRILNPLWLGELKKFKV